METYNLNKSSERVREKQKAILKSGFVVAK